MKLLEDYIKVLKIEDNVYKNLCADSISNSCNKWEKHLWYGYNSLTHVKNDKELFVCKPSKNDIENWEIVTKKVIEYYNSFFIQGTGVNFCAPIRYNWYKTGTLMKSHSDHIKSLFDGVRKGIPTLSVVYALNDHTEYKGGDFVFDNLNLSYRLGVGEVLVFPSLFLYNHHVTEITEGDRYTAVTWMY